MARQKRSTNHDLILEKVPTGIKGLDEVTYGGFPKGRTILVTGGPGSGKSMLAMEFLVRGALFIREPGVFVSFEETPEEIVTNGASLGFDLEKLAEDRNSIMDYVYVERTEIEETGEYDLEGAVHPSRPCHRVYRRQKGSPGYDRVALCRASQQGNTCGPSCAGSSAGSRTKA